MFVIIEIAFKIRMLIVTSTAFPSRHSPARTLGTAVVSLPVLSVICMYTQLY